MMLKTVLVTGSSGFIGFHLSKKLLELWYKVVWLDIENDYYDVNLKIARRNELVKSNNFKFYKQDLCDLVWLKKIFEENTVDKVVNLAAQAWVTYSYKNPFEYIQSNIVGFHNLIDVAKNFGIENFVYASTGSVYGDNTKDPAEAKDQCETPLSIYAASKKSNELIAYSYSSMYWLSTIGLRFFNVIWPWWRPDSALYIFTKNILEGKSIDVRNHGKMRRNNTYVGDIVDGIVLALDYQVDKKYHIFNLWNERKVELMYFIERIEHELWLMAEKKYVDMLPGEPAVTSVDSAVTRDILWWSPKVGIEEGIAVFVQWYKLFVDY